MSSSRPAGSSPTTTCRRSRKPEWRACSGREPRSAKWPSSSAATSDELSRRAVSGGADADLTETPLTVRARNGDRRALARLLTAVENRTQAGEEALRELYPLAGGAHLVGVTGAPGSGKSTLVAALVGEARKSARPVAVIAIDPSSPITGGAILGDRVRMQRSEERR